MADKIDVLIVEKWPLFREALGYALEGHEEILCVGVVGEKDEAINLIKEKRPDIILLDYFTSPYKELLEMSPQEMGGGKIIITSLEPDHRVIRETFKYNIRGFILMSISPQELINAIKAVHNGGIYIDRELIFAALRDYTSNSKKDEIFLDPLTHKEEEVLELLRKGLSNREIAKLLGISEKTVKSHLTDIFSKLNVKSRLEAVIVTNELLRKSDINLRPKSY